MTTPPTEMDSTVPAPGGDQDRASSSEIDASCRWTVLALFVGALFWLAAISGLQALASFKLLMPGILARCEFLSYGRLEGAVSCGLVFGFAIPALLALLTWIQCRLGGQPLAGALGFWIFGSMWNLGVLGSVVGILAGDGSGLAWFELPVYGAAPMAAAYIVGAGVLLLNVKLRAVREMHVAQWFLLLSVIWFGWAFTVAILLNQSLSSGLIHLVVGYWFKQQLFFMTLLPGALAVVFYVMPKVADVPVRPRSMALFAFWTLVFIGPWGGIPQSAPLPAWMVSVGVVAGTLMLVPVLATMLTVRDTLGGECGALRRSGEGALVMGSVLALALFAGLNWVRNWPGFAGVVELSIFSKGLSLLLVLGVCGLGVLGGIHHAVPKLTGAEWTQPSWIRVHSAASMLGVLAIVAGLLLAGVFQGLQNNRLGATASEILASARPMLALSALGCVVYFLAQAALFGAVLWQSALACRTCCLPCLIDWTKAGVVGKAEVGR